MIISISNQNKRVSKTISATNIVGDLSELGDKSLLVDLDYYPIQSNRESACGNPLQNSILFNRKHLIYNS